MRQGFLKMNWVSEPQDMEMIFCTFFNKMIAHTKNIEYGIYYRSAEKYVRFFMDEYRRAVEAL